MIRRFRDALTGRYTTKAEADLAPGSHVAETPSDLDRRYLVLQSAVVRFLDAWDGHGSGTILDNAVRDLRVALRYGAQR